MLNSTLVRIGTRGSALARWQTEHVAGLLRAAHPGLEVEITVITTQGDRMLDQPLASIGGKGVFTAELEAALRGGTIDFAVHSLKDLPTDSPEGVTLGAITQRADPSDVLVSRDGRTLKTLPMGSVVGTSSRRRAAQLLHLRPDLEIRDLRGNVDTRLRKVLEAGEYDAIVLAYAGLARLGLLNAVTEKLSFDDMLPAPGQGALAIQSRDDDSSALLAPLADANTTAAVTAERAFLAGLGGGCSLPIAAYGEVIDGEIRLRGRVSAPDGSQQIDVALHGTDAETLGYQLADAALASGAGALLESAES